MWRGAILLTLLLALVAAGETRDIARHQKNIQHPNIGPMDFGWGVAHDAVPDLFVVNKFGINGDIDATEESVWDAPDLGGPLRCFTVLGQTPSVLYFSSSNALDAGKQVTVEGLTTGYAIQNTTITLGAAAVTSGTAYAAGGTWLRINRMYATSDALVGNIYAHTDAVDGGNDGIPDSPSTQIVAVISAGENQTLQACYTVPAGYNALVMNSCISNVTQIAVGDAITFRMRASEEGAAPRTQHLLTLGNEISLCSESIPPIHFDEKTDVEFTGADSASQAVAATFGLILLPEDWR